MPRAAMSKSDKIRKYLAEGHSPADVAKKVGVSVNFVYNVRWNDQKKAEKKAAKKAEKKAVKAAEKVGKEAHKIATKRGRPRKVVAEEGIVEVKQEDTKVPTLEDLFAQGAFDKDSDFTPHRFSLDEEYEDGPDLINDPPHYKVGGIDTWDFILAKELSYNAGVAVSYISRADYKGDYIGDLKKAVAHLNREITYHEQNEARLMQQVNEFAAEQKGLNEV